jgi:hypothetical protein
VIILRHESFVSAKIGSATSVRSEVYNLNWRFSKTIDEGPRLDSFSESGTVLYVEEGDTKDKIENYNWHKEFNKAFDNIYFKLNDPNIASAEFNISVHVQRQ